MDKINLGAFENAYFFNARNISGKLLIGLHGRGDNAQSFCGVRHGLRLSDFDQLYLNAPDEWNVAFSRGFSWYDMAPDQMLGIGRSYKLLEELIVLLEERGYRRDKILLFGFSQGCLMSLELAIRSSSAFMGVLGISGTLYEVNELISKIGQGGRETPYFLTHGYDDEILPFENSKKAYDSLSSELTNIEFKALTKGHNIADIEWDLFHRKIIEWSGKVKS